MDKSAMEKLVEYRDVPRLDKLSFSTILTPEIVSHVDSFLENNPGVDLRLDIEGGFSCLKDSTEIPKHLRTLRTTWSGIATDHEVDVFLNVLEQSPGGMKFDARVMKDCAQHFLDARPNMEITFNDFRSSKKVFC